MLANMASSKPKLRWLQYSLLTLLILVTLAIPSSWVVVKTQQAKREQEAAAAIEKFGAWVEWSEPSESRWLRSLMGDACFRRVVRVELNGTPVTDAGLQHLKGLDHLERLGLNQTRITDAGLEHLRGLNRLQVLGLMGTQITDAGLEHIKGLNQLHVLWLDGTQVTDQGETKLKQALPKCTMSRQPLPSSPPPHARRVCILPPPLPPQARPIPACAACC